MKQYGVAMITDIREEGKGAAIANTYFFQTDSKNYILDPACGKKRLLHIRDTLRDDYPENNHDVLVTHSHLDHSGNSGAVAAESSRVILHPEIAGRINNLKRNYTEITAAMVQAFGIEGFFGRTGMLGPVMIRLALLVRKIIPSLFNLLLYMLSLLMCRVKSGRIHAPKKNAVYLERRERQELTFGQTTFRGWRLSDNLYALDTPGHINDHLSFYIPDRGIMFTGDLVNFINPNDVIDGSIRETHRGLNKMLEMAQTGRINVLATGHALPSVGKENVIAFLQETINRQNEMFNTVAEVIQGGAGADAGAGAGDVIFTDNGKKAFEEIIAGVYQYDSDLMKKLVKINYPRSATFIDVYVYIYLKEYHTLN